MDIRRQVRTAIKWLPLLAIAGVVAGVVGYALLSTQPRIYEASTTLRLGQALSGAPIPVTIVSDRLVTEYAYRSTTLATLGGAAASIGLELPAEEVDRFVSTTVEPGSTLITITARAGRPEVAAAFADAIGDQLIAFSAAAQGQSTVQGALIDDIDELRREIDRARATIAELSAIANPTPADIAEIAALEDVLVDRITAHGDVLDRLRAIGAHSIDVVSPAAIPASPIEPRVTLFTLLAVFLGILVGAGLAVLLQYFDDTVHEASELERASGLPTLGLLTEYSRDIEAGGIRRLVMTSAPRSSAAEGYRRLRVNVELASDRGPLRTLLVTATEPEMGTSVTAANLAIAFAESGSRVVLIDGRLDRPALHHLFGLDNERGLSAYLASDRPSSAGFRLMTSTTNLEVIPAGKTPVNVAWALGSPQMKTLIAELVAMAAIVIVTSPAVPTASDALILSAELHQTLLVVGQDRTRADAVRKALDALRIARADVLGTALLRHRRGSATSGQTVVPASVARTGIGGDGERSLDRRGV